MSNVLSVKAKDFIKVIKKLGFYLDRQKGSHAIYKDDKGHRVVVPIHSGKDLKTGTLNGMITDLDYRARNFFRVTTKVKPLRSYL